MVIFHDFFNAAQRTRSPIRYSTSNTTLFTMDCTTRMKCHTEILRDGVRWRPINIMEGTGSFSKLVVHPEFSAKCDTHQYPSASTRHSR